MLYHPACNHLVREHMQILAQKVRYKLPMKARHPLGELTSYPFLLDHRRLRNARGVS